MTNGNNLHKVVLLDEIDLQILNILNEDASITGTDMAEKVGLSIPATNKRIAKLIDAGVIERYTIRLDPDRIGKPLVAFILVILESVAFFDFFNDFISAEQDVLECYATTGEFDDIMKVCAKDMADLEEKLMGLKRVKGVVKTNTMVSLCTHKAPQGIMPDPISK